MSPRAPIGLNLAMAQCLYPREDDYQSLDASARSAVIVSEVDYPASELSHGRSSTPPWTVTLLGLLLTLSVSFPRCTEQISKSSTYTHGRLGVGLPPSVLLNILCIYPWHYSRSSVAVGESCLSLVFGAPLSFPIRHAMYPLTNA